MNWRVPIADPAKKCLANGFCGFEFGKLAVQLETIENIRWVVVAAEHGWPSWQ